MRRASKKKQPSIWRRRLKSLRVYCWLALVVATTLSLADDVAEEKPARKFDKPVLIRFEGEVSPFMQAYFYRKLDHAKSIGADLVIVEIDSPGGYLHTCEEITDRLSSIEWAHVAAFVPNKALSAAAIMSLGCDEIVMAPDGRIGDAGPIFADKNFLFRHAPEKIRSDLVRFVRDRAEAKGRPPAIAEAMVDMEVEIFRCTHKDTEEAKWLSQHELDEDGGEETWEKGPRMQESRDGYFLEVNGERAQEIGLSDGVAEDRAALNDYFALERDPIVMETNWVDTTVMILNSTFVTILLFIIGLIALFVELSAPGISVGGLIAGLCFVLFFWSRFLGGTSGWLEILLFVCGLVFLGVELFVIPGFGVSGVAGILLIVASLVMAGQDFKPMDGLDVGKTSTSLLTVLGAGAAAFIAMACLSSYFGKIPILSSMALEPPKPTTEEVVVDEKTGKPVSVTAESGLQIQVGDWGKADSPLRPAGKAMFEDEYVDVVTDGSFVEKGAQVRVVKISGTKIVVREIEDVS